MKGAQIKFRSGSKVVLAKVFGYNLVSTNATSLDENDIHGRNVITHIETIGTGCNKGKVWTRNGWEISDLIAAGLVSPYKAAKPVMPKRIAHWVRQIHTSRYLESSFNIEDYNEMYIFIQDAYKAAKRGGTQQDFLFKVKQQYRDDEKRACAMFMLASIVK